LKTITFLIAVVLLVGFQLISPRSTGAISYDKGIQDNSGIPFVQWNSSTGQYLYSDCASIVLQGTGSAFVGADGHLDLNFKNGTFKGAFSINPFAEDGAGRLTNNSTGQLVETITDSDLKGDTFTCP
jgi:hypothetical protein